MAARPNQEATISSSLNQAAIIRNLQIAETAYPLQHFQIRSNVIYHQSAQGRSSHGNSSPAVPQSAASTIHFFLMAI